MEEQSALSLFKTLPSTKSEVKHFVSILKPEILEGNVDIIKFVTQLTSIEFLVKTLKSDVLIKDVLLEESEKYRTKSFEEGNAKFQIKEVGTKYDYSGCNDERLEFLNLESNRIATLKKARESFLKTINPETEVYDSDGVQLFAPVKTSTTQVVITLK